jgi:hypothetical protein
MHDRAGIPSATAAHNAAATPSAGEHPLERPGAPPAAAETFRWPAGRPRKEKPLAAAWAAARGKAFRRRLC